MIFGWEGEATAEPPRRCVTRLQTTWRMYLDLLNAFAHRLGGSAGASPSLMVAGNARAGLFASFVVKSVLSKRANCQRC